jgi:hypothetical protein
MAGALVTQLKAMARDAYEMAIKTQMLLDQKGHQSGPFDGAITSYAIAIHDKIEETVPILRDEDASNEIPKRGYGDRLETFYNHVSGLQIRPDGPYDRHRVEVLIRTAEILAGVAGVSNSPVRIEADKRHAEGSDSE